MEPRERTFSIRSRRLVQGALFAALGVIGTGLDAGAQDANEPNDIPDECTAVLHADAVEGSVDPAGDLDWFCFDGLSGEAVAIDVDASQLGSSLDPVLEVYDPNLTLIALDDDTHGLDPYVTVVLPESGTYFVLLRSSGHPCCGGPTFTFTLTVNLASVAVPPLGSGRVVGIESVSPNPASGPVTIRYGIPAAMGGADLAVFDVTGRRVRTLDHARAPGGAVAFWDLVTDHGAEAGAGVYFVTLRSGAQRWTRRLLLVR